MTFPVRPGSYQRSRANDFAPRISTGNDPSLREDIWDVWAQTGAPSELARLVAEFLPAAGLPALERTIATYQGIGMWTGELAISPDLYAHTVKLFRTFDGLTIDPPYADLVVPYPHHG